MTTSPTGDVALVTGANKGIGKEIVRQLAAAGLTVYLGTRDEDRGATAAKELAADGGDVRYVRLDVTDEPGIADAVRLVETGSGRLDILVNNAGIVAEWGVDVPDVTAEHLRRTYQVNVFGVVAVTHAFLPLLRRSVRPRIVNLSSPLGSLGLLALPDSPIAGTRLLGYSSSKTALNAITQWYAHALKEEGVAVNAVNPGFVASDLNGHRGVLSTAEGAAAPVRLALLDEQVTGTFQGRHPNHTDPTVRDQLDAVLPW
jgi:NAD(P)-dependent dehydrogenase (short-subunit alcohol dehydrogenase family)